MCLHDLNYFPRTSLADYSVTWPQTSRSAKPPASRRERLALMATPMDEDTPVIDEDMQSRQMAVYGRESMQKLRKASVLISGLNGLGAEIAKNVILSNPAAVSAAAHRVALQHATAAHCA